MKPKNRLARMLRKLNIDVLSGLDLNMPMVSKAAEICVTCQNTNACELWMCGGKRDDGYKIFCPNAARLDCLPRTQGLYRRDRLACGSVHQ